MPKVVTYNGFSRPHPAPFCHHPAHDALSFLLDFCPGSSCLTRKPEVKGTGHTLYILVGHWTEGGRGKIQEAKPGKVLHVEKKTGGSVRALLLASAGGWGVIRVSLKLLGQNIKRGRDMDMSSLRDYLRLPGGLKIGSNYYLFLGGNNYF